MGGGTSAPTTTTVNQNTSNLPAYAEPYFTSLMGQAQAATNPNNYTPYGMVRDASGNLTQAYDASGNPLGQRIAPFTQQQQQVQSNILDQQMPGQFQAGSQLAATAGLGALGASQYDPSQFSAMQAQGPNLNMYQMGGPQQFDQNAAQQYMSPYMQSAVDVQKDQAIRDAQKAQLAQNLGAARQGTYGGARQLLAQTENQRNLGTQLANIQATGQQQAFQNAQTQFNTQQALQQQAAQNNLNAALGVQNTGAQYGMQAQLANQQQWLAAQQAAEQSKQFGANLGLQGLAQTNQAAQTLGNLGATQQQTQSALLNQQQSAAAQTQALQQSALDQQYQDYLTQQQYPLQMLQQYSSLLHGVPVTPQTTATYSSTAAAPSLASQLVSGGLGAASLANMLGKTG